MNAFLKRIIYFIPFLIILGCSKDDTNKNYHSKTTPVYKFQLRVFGGLGPLQQILIHPDMDSAYYLYSIPEVDTSRRVPYKLQHKIPFHLSTIEKDSILNMTKHMITKFNFEEEIPNHLDGGIIEISLSMNGKTLETTYAGLDKVQNASPEVEPIVNFFNRKLAGRIRLE